MRKLLIAVVLFVIFMTVEVVGGIKANSLAILTDAAHLLSDVADFSISLFSLWASGWEANPHQSYGFFRIEMLGALVSIQLIWLLPGILVYEAIVRLLNDTGEVQGVLMFAVAAFGLVVNIIMAVLLGHDHGHGPGGHRHDHGHGGHSHEHSNSSHDHSHDLDHSWHGHAHEHRHGSDVTSHHHHLQEGKHGDGHEPLIKHAEDSPKKQRNIIFIVHTFMCFEIPSREE